MIFPYVFFFILLPRVRQYQGFHSNRTMYENAWSSHASSNKGEVAKEELGLKALTEASNMSPLVWRKDFSQIVMKFTQFTGFFGTPWVQFAGELLETWPWRFLTLTLEVVAKFRFPEPWWPWGNVRTSCEDSSGCFLHARDRRCNCTPSPGHPKNGVDLMSYLQTFQYNITWYHAAICKGKLKMCLTFSRTSPSQIKWLTCADMVLILESWNGNASLKLRSDIYRISISDQQRFY